VNIAPKSEKDLNCRPFGRQFLVFTELGATKAKTLEHIYGIAQWLFENRNYTAFKSPQISALQRAEQMERMNYAY
jgi:hypothetical protein